MTELSGTLEGVGLPAIIRFLSGLEKTGCLRIVHDDWQGEIVFEAGQVTGASLGSRHGLSALDGLVQTLSGGSFLFDTSPRPGAQANIELPPPALQKHLDELVARIVGGTPNLPSVDSVPEVIVQDEVPEGAEPLPLDRATLQTLLAVDGKRTVRQIVAQRGSFEALWQLGSLAEVGLVRLSSHDSDGHGSDGRGSDGGRASSPVEPVTSNVAEARVDSPSSLSPEELQSAAPHCPKLGFEDDPDNAFDRPTRLHRCFAADTPLPLSLDQQRELCLSDQFGTCPRLTMSAARRPVRPPSRDARTAPGPRKLSGNAAPAIGTAGRSDVLPADGQDARIVRLPFGARNPAAQRGPGSERATPQRGDSSERGAPQRGPIGERGAPQRGPGGERGIPQRGSSGEVPLPPRGAGGEWTTPSSSEPTHLHAPTSAQRIGDSPRPTPLRARIDRATSAGSAPTQPESAARKFFPEPQPDERPTFRTLIDGGPALPRVGGVPLVFVVGGAIAVILLAVIGYVFATQYGELFPDTTDLSGLPNASAVAAGTPVEQIAPRPTRVPGAPAVPAASAVPAAPGVPPAPADPNASGVSAAPADPAAAGASGAAANPGASAASTAAAVPAASAVPDAAGAPASANPGASAAAATAVAPTQAPALSPASAQPAANAQSTPVPSTKPPLLDERFTDNARNWPSNAQGTAWMTNSSYHLIPREAGQFVAVGAPIPDLLQDVVATATFHKLSGTPDGGGFGIILRDQGTAPLDGTSQGGQYYVLEVGDKGEVGMWRRDANTWVDLLPWQHSDAVHPGTAINELVASVVGNRLNLSVNGTEVATHTDNTLTSGRVGLLAGGDGNQIAVDHFTVQTP